MLARYPSEVACDFAQYYHIYNREILTAAQAATLACGLPDESRTVKALRGVKHSQTDLLLAAIYDNISILIYAQNKGKKGRSRRPESLLKKMLSEKKRTEIQGFSSAEAFEEARRKILEG